MTPSLQVFVAIGPVRAAAAGRRRAGGVVREGGSQVAEPAPDFGDWSVALAAFIIPITIQWWASGIPERSPAAGATSRPDQVPAIAHRCDSSRKTFKVWASGSIRHTCATDSADAVLAGGVSA